MSRVAAAAPWGGDGQRGILTPIVFEDVSQSSRLITVGVDAGLAHGRLEITRFGLVLQGICTNEACEFKGLMVNMCLGIGTFELAYEHAKFRCPRCALYVIPETCLYVGCWWKVIGIMRRGSGEAPERVETHWRCTTSLRYDCYRSLEVATWYALRFTTMSVMQPESLMSSFNQLDKTAYKRIVLESVLAASGHHQVAFMHNSKQDCFLDMTARHVWEDAPAFEVIFDNVIHRLSSEAGVKDFVGFCEKRAVLEAMTTRIGSLWDDISWALVDAWTEDDDLVLRSMARTLVFEQPNAERRQLANPLFGCICWVAPVLRAVFGGGRA